MMNFEEMTKKIKALESMSLALTMALETGDDSGCACSDFYPMAEEIKNQLENLHVAMNRALEARSVEMVG